MVARVFILYFLFKMTPFCLNIILLNVREVKTPLWSYNRLLAIYWVCVCVTLNLFCCCFDRHNYSRKSHQLFHTRHARLYYTMRTTLWKLLVQRRGVKTIFRQVKVGQELGSWRRLAYFGVRRLTLLSNGHQNPFSRLTSLSLQIGTYLVEHETHLDRGTLMSIYQCFHFSYFLCMCLFHGQNGEIEVIDIWQNWVYLAI